MATSGFEKKIDSSSRGTRGRVGEAETFFPSRTFLSSAIEQGEGEASEEDKVRGAYFW